MRALPLRYAGWMARDVAMGPGAVMLAIAALATFVLSRITSMPEGAAQAADVLRGILDQAAKPIILLATGGMVSGDLHTGYYRSIFSKPVSPPLYYLQRWLVGAAAVLLFVPVMAAGISLRLGSYPFSLELVVQLLLQYLLLGGLVFFLSTLTRRDWLLALLAATLQLILHAIQNAGAHLGTLGSTIYHVLPPFHLTDLGAPPPTGGDLLYVLLYGGTLVLAALAVLHARPLGVGGRA
jgi:ABC-type transport system involved in multi-copper enzyme maturation permease subunit